MIRKFSLDDLTIVIPFRQDSKRRYINLKYVIKYLKNNFDNLKIIIGEIDKKPKLKNYHGCDYVFLKTERDFVQKTKILNLLIHLAKTNIICSYDCDILLNPLDIVKSYNLIKFKQIDFALPYNRHIRSIRGKDTKRIFKEIRCGGKNPFFLNYISHTHGAVGGAFIFDKEKFINFGMENEEFEGWGYEDDERYYRLTKLDNIIHCMDYPAYHLYHPRNKFAQNIFSEQSKLNKTILENNILNKSKKEIVKIIKNWNWCLVKPNIKTSKNKANIRIAFYSIYSDKETTLKVVNKYTPNLDFKFENLKLVKDNENYDFIVTNYAFQNLDDDIVKHKGIVIQSEPKWFRELMFPKNYINPREGIDCYKLFSIEKYHTLDFHWCCFDSTYTQIKNRYLELFSRNHDRITSIVSNKFVNMDGLNYLNRIKFLQYLDKLESCFIYGQLNKEFENEITTEILKSLKNFNGKCESKEQQLINSEYNFDAENCCEKNYFTEKAFGGILCDSLTFYYGCPNIEKFIDSRCYIKIDLNNLEESFETVKKCIRDREIYKRLGIINYNKQLIIRKFNPLRILQEFIEDRYE